MERIKEYIILFMLSSLIAGCAFSALRRAGGLPTAPATPAEITGTYTLILYGGNYLEDLETIALLDKEGDRYAFEPYAPEFNYRVIKNIPAKDALAAAEKFVSINPSFSRSQLSKILDPQDAVIGYEVRPLYQTLTYGVPDVLEVNYFPEGDKVVVRIKLLPFIERKIFDSDRHERGVFR